MTDEKQAADPAATPLSGIAGARYVMEILSPFEVSAPGFDYAFQVQVALPASYGASPERRYAALWLTDGPAFLPLAVGVLDSLVMSGLAPETILIGIGHAPEVGLAECVRRRTEDFGLPGAEYFFDGPGGDRLRSFGAPTAPERQRADRFLAFLVDRLRPRLEAELRISGRHGLVGHSGGGMFAGYALFARPGAFSDFLISSPSLNATGRKIFQMEQAHAAAHDDLPVGLFLCAGDAELESPGLAAWGVVSSMALLAETLLLRNYPSLRLVARIFSGRGHADTPPELLRAGLRTVWNEAIDR